MTGRPGHLGGVAHDNRRFLNAVVYLAKTGLPWRDLPAVFGKWDTVYHRYNAWCQKGGGGRGSSRPSRTRASSGS